MRTYSFYNCPLVYHSLHPITNHEKRKWEQFQDAVNCKRILDIGAGSSRHASLFEERFYLGLDLAFPMLKLSNQKSIPIQGNWLNIPVQNHSFDLILFLNNSIHHCGNIEQIESIARQFKAILMPGGYLVLECLDYWRCSAELNKESWSAEKQIDFQGQKIMIKETVTAVEKNRLSVSWKLDSEKLQLEETLNLFPEQDLQAAFVNQGFKVDKRFPRRGNHDLQTTFFFTVP